MPVVQYIYIYTCIRGFYRNFYDNSRSQVPVLVFPLLLLIPLLMRLRTTVPTVL